MEQLSASVKCARAIIYMRHFTMMFRDNFRVQSSDAYCTCKYMYIYNVHAHSNYMYMHVHVYLQKAAVLAARRKGAWKRKHDDFIESIRSARVVIDPHSGEHYIIAGLAWG